MKLLAGQQGKLRSKRKLVAAAMTAVALAVGAAAQLSRADTITLSNGDRLSGSIDRITPTLVILDTNYGGVITLERSAVAAMVSVKPVQIVDANGTSHEAFVAPTANHKGWVETQVAPPADALVLPAGAPATPPPPVKAPAPAQPISLFGPYWDNSLTLGLTNLTGNTEQTEFAGNVNFHYKHVLNELGINFAGAYGTTNGVQDNGSFAGNAIYRRELPSWWPKNHWYAFVESNNLYDEIKGISFRTQDIVGLGYYLISTKKLEVDVRAGPGVLYERFFHGGDITAPIAAEGLRAVYKLNTRVTLSENLLATQSLEYPSRDYQFTTITAANLAIPEVMRGLSLTASFEDDYDNSALETGKKPNDTRTLVGLTLGF
ncbi:MAG: DUF481 domain-containing protein [Phycisphaerae bacterium]